MWVPAVAVSSGASRQKMRIAQDPAHRRDLRPQTLVRARLAALGHGEQDQQGDGRRERGEADEHGAPAEGLDRELGRQRRDQDAERA